MLGKVFQHRIAQGHNSLLPCHGSHGSPSDVEDKKAKDSVLGSVPECPHNHSHSPSIDPISMAMAQGDSGYQSPVDNVSIPTELGSLATVIKPGREVLSCQSPVLSKDANSGVSHSTGQFHKTSTPKSLRVFPTLTESLVQDWPEPPLLVDGHSPTNALGKNNGTEAQVATVPLQQVYRDHDLSNDLVPEVLSSKVPNYDPQADSSLFEYPESSHSSSQQCIAGYS